MASIYANNAERQKAYRERYRERIENRLETHEERIARLQQTIEDLQTIIQRMWKAEKTITEENNHGLD